MFAEDIFPDTPGGVAALQADDWFNGADADPIKVRLCACPRCQLACSRNTRALVDFAA